jgi:hypothetical protein
MKNQKRTKRFTLQEHVICTECYGEGVVEVGPHCYRPASECCGGCYQTQTCYVCDGDKHITIDEDDEDMLDKAMMLHSVRYRLRRFTDLKIAIDHESTIMGTREHTDNMIERIDLIKAIDSLSRLEDALVDEINQIAQYRAQNKLI